MPLSANIQRRAQPFCLCLPNSLKLFLYLLHSCTRVVVEINSLTGEGPGCMAQSPKSPK